MAIRAHFTGLAPALFVDGGRAKDPISFWMLVSCYRLCATGRGGGGALLGLWE